jgi:hypothetical protein
MKQLSKIPELMAENGKFSSKFTDNSALRGEI